MRLVGTTAFIPGRLSHLARAYADLGRFDDARRSIDDAPAAVERTKERWREADILRVAGEIALLSREPDEAKAEAYFQRALSVARRRTQSPGNCAPQ